MSTTCAVDLEEEEEEGRYPLRDRLCARVVKERGEEERLWNALVPPLRLLGEALLDDAVMSTTAATPEGEEEEEEEEDEDDEATEKPKKELLACRRLTLLAFVCFPPPRALPGFALLRLLPIPDPPRSFFRPGILHLCATAAI
jgi:hypothetical protein